MIFYFSGTGNSQIAAKQIAQHTGDKIVSINEHLKTGQKRCFYSERPFIFVTPTYAWKMPRVAERWILENEFKGNSKAYFILTCAGGTGNAAVYAKKLCEKKKMDFYGLASVMMPENYVAMFAVPDEAECRAIMEKAKPCIKALAAQIQSDEPFCEPPVSIQSKVLSGPVNRLYYPLIVHDKGFTVSDKCVSCGKCANRCPLKNIDMVKGKPVWNGNCTHCMACIGGCPVEVIEYKSKSRGKRRYYVMKDSFMESE